VVKQGKVVTGCTLGDSDRTLEKIHYVSTAALKQVSQRGCGMSILGGFQNLSGKRQLTVTT